MNNQSTVAVLIPCFNEAQTIADVVGDFRQALPDADIYVYDNNSTDETTRMAMDANAIVRSEHRQGKGFVVRSMFQEIDADYYLMVDGDSTYDAEQTTLLLEPLFRGKAHMTVGVRLKSPEPGAFRAMHRMGNSIITGTINRLFNAGLTDVLSGYRGFRRDVVKTTPLLSSGFEVETELTLHALDARHKIVEVPVHYRTRPPGSHSKLNTFRDGWLILCTILGIFKDYKPLLFFGLLAAISFFLGIFTGLPVVYEYLQTGLVPRFPTAILAASLVMLALQFLGIGLILETMARHRRMAQELWILGQ